MTALPPPDLTVTIAKVIAHAPEWLRRDLSSPEARSREQAEETLAAMISAALRDPATARDETD